MKDFSEYKKTVAYLESLINLPQKYDYMKNRENPGVYLKRTQAFLDLIGNPEKDFKYIHVSGTSGKGTVSSMLAKSLTKFGKKTGLIVSPFSVSTIEKISIDGLYIAPQDFVRIVNFLKPYIEESYMNSKYGRPSYFETLLAIALIYFKEQKCDWVVAEVGCGGRFDYTNIIPKKEVAVITNIDKDHLHLIGPTLKDVAYEKAGIIKKDSEFFTTEHRPELLNIFQKECKKVGAAFNLIARGDGYKETNKNLVKAVLDYLKLPTEKVEEAFLPCRFEEVQKTPSIILDGAHNPAKISALVERYKKEKKKKSIVIFSSGEGKDAKKMIDSLLSVATEFYITRMISGPYKPYSPKSLHQYLKKKGMKATVFLDPYQAIEDAMKKGKPILVAGSFFLAGDLRKRWYSEEYVLKNRKSK